MIASSDEHPPKIKENKLAFQELLGALGCAAVLAYTTGWIYDVSYYDGLEVPWLADYLTPLHHLRSSLMPAILCCIFLISILGGQFLASHLKRDSDRPRADLNDLIWRLLVVGVMFGSLYLIDGWRMVSMGLVMGMLFVSGILIHTGSAGRQTPLYAALLLLVMPLNLGHIDAEYDLNRDSTSLPLIRAANIRDRDVYGVLLTDSIVYCIDLDRRGEVIPVSMDEIYQMGRIVEPRKGANRAGAASQPSGGESDASEESLTPVE